MELNLYLSPCIKVNLNCIKGQLVKPEMLKRLERNTGSTL